MGMVPELLHASFYDSLGLFEHILTDFEISPFLHTPIPPLLLPSLDRYKSSEMSLAFPDFVQILAKSGKILRNIPRLLEALHGCAEIEKIQNQSKWGLDAPKQSQKSIWKGVRSITKP